MLCAMNVEEKKKAEAEKEVKAKLLTQPSNTGFFQGVKRSGRRLLYGSGFHAAQRSSARSLALPLAGASRQNATDRTVRRVRAP